MAIAPADELVDKLTAEGLKHVSKKAREVGRHQSRLLPAVLYGIRRPDGRKLRLEAIRIGRGGTPRTRPGGDS